MTQKTKLLGALALAVALPFVSLAAAETPARVVITTVSGERVVGIRVAEDADSVRLNSPTFGEVRIPRAAIVTMTASTDAPPPAPAPSPPPPSAPPAPVAKPGFVQSRLHLPGKFDVTVGLGLTHQSGLLEQTSWLGSLGVAWAVDEYSLQSSVQMSRQSVHGRVYNDSLHWDTQLRRAMNPKWFLVAANYYREDLVMTVDREEVVFVGAGYTVVKTPTCEAVLVAGPSYIWQDYLPPPGGGPAPRPLGDPAAVFAPSVNYALLPHVRLSASGLIAQSVEEQKKRLMRLTLSLDVALTERLTLSNGYQWQHDSLPRIGTDQNQGMLTSQLKLGL